VLEAAKSLARSCKKSYSKQQKVVPETAKSEKILKKIFAD